MIYSLGKSSFKRESTCMGYATRKSNSAWPLNADDGTTMLSNWDNIIDQHAYYLDSVDNIIR